MPEQSIPFERLKLFMEQLDLGPEALELLAAHAPALAAHAPAFGREFCDYFLAIERTRLVLEQGDNLPRLEKILAQWFEGMFSRGFSRSFVTYLWDSGVRHVQLSLDQRFVNLGYAMTRSFCHRIIAQDIPLEHQARVASVVDRMLDFCVLVATDSFITMTSRCDRSMIEGIAHQVRNPITVIGGNIRRLQRQAPPDSPASKSYDMVLAENRRLERMVGDISAYTALFRDEPHPAPCELAPSLDQARAWLGQRDLLQGVAYRQDLDPALPRVRADCKELELILCYLLENAAEAADPSDARVAVSSRPAATPGFVEIAIHNTGKAPQPQDMELMLSPFHSSKPMGTGLGLPIAALAARRNLGSLRLEPGPQGGVVCYLDLPLPPAG